MADRPRTRVRLVVGAVWAVVVGAVGFAMHRSEQSPLELVQTVIDVARGAWWAPIVFFVAYAIAPLVFFPASVLTIAGGLLFGPVWGSVLVVLSANTSAMVAYTVGRSLSSMPEDGGDGATLAQRWSARLRAESFTTVLVMRLAFLPYDVVNYLCGVLKITRLSFITATAIGSLPGTLAFVLAGASLTRLDEGVGGIDVKVLAASVVLSVVSFGIARILKQRTSQISGGDTPEPQGSGLSTPNTGTPS